MMQFVKDKSKLLRKTNWTKLFSSHNCRLERYDGLILKVDTGQHL